MEFGHLDESPGVLGKIASLAQHNTLIYRLVIVIISALLVFDVFVRIYKHRKLIKKRLGIIICITLTYTCITSAMLFIICVSTECNKIMD